ncbi:LytTR family DNA-binding domain-containing protein [uncultured Psychroserpens sp.]|uniref:LytR/AlgR family response regulator transcription factor n=1 Tax=uncultured Psychroserpens sp. TaxID=255436 RepID=UPI002604AECE|nr:LytTR family DNA-binding domain-containing protein [uncultured Psychroserpens sp.]
MKNYRIYILISVVFSVVYMLSSFVAVQIISKNSTILLLEHEIDSGRRRAKEISLISSKALENKVEKQDLVLAIQKSIEDVNDEISFLSVIDWSGKMVCYPDITKVGTIDTKKNAMISNIKNEILVEDLYKFIDNYDLDEEGLNASEIIRLDPIANSDLIVATHINLKNFINKTGHFKSSYFIVFIILGLLVLILLLGITRYLSSYYYEALEKRSSRLEDGMLNLSKLNVSLENYQKNIAIIKEKQAKDEIEAFEKEDEEDVKEFPKKRLLTYIRNELMPVSIEDISYIYVENTITYIVRKDGKRFTANDSLDQIYSSLDDKLFFRANRQIIVSIYAIDKIIKFGNSSLKIETKPASEIDIVIGKNKASSFKQWLDL